MIALIDKIKWNSKKEIKKKLIKIKKCKTKNKQKIYKNVKKWILTFKTQEKVKKNVIKLITVLSVKRKLRNRVKAKKLSEECLRKKQSENN